MENAENYLTLALKLKPKCALYYYFGGYVKRKQGKLIDAIEMFEKADDLSNQIPQLKFNSKYELGWCYYLQMNFEKAIECFSYFLSNSKGSSYLAYCAYQLGVSYSMLGKNEEAIESFKKVEIWERKHYTFDQYAKRKAQEYVNNEKMSELEIKLVTMDILNFAKKSEECIQFIEENTKDFDTESEEWAISLYWKGKAYSNLRKFDEAKNCFKEVLSLESYVVSEIYILPHSLVELGEIAYAKGDLDKAFKYFGKAKNNYKNYDYDKSLIRQISKVL